jgi:hypothetical protein
MNIQTRMGAPPRGGLGRRSQRLEAILIAVVLVSGPQARAAVTLEPVGHLPAPRYLTAIVARGDVAYGIGKLIDQVQSPAVLRVFDISDPEAPVVIATIDAGDAAYALAASGDYLYYARSRSLRVVNVSDPSNPYQVSSLTTPGGAPAKMAVAEGRLFWAHQGSPAGKGVQVVDISNPSAPLAQPAILPGTNLAGVAVEGNLLYVTPLLGGLYIFDVTNLSSAQQLSFLPLDGYSGSVAAGGGYAYVAGDGSGLQIVDVSDPADPALVAGCTYPGALVVDVRLVGRYAVLGLDEGGVAIVDVVDPTNPICNPRQPVPGLGWTVDVSGDHLVVATFFQGLATYRIHGGIGACCAGGDCWETVEEGCESPLRGDGQPCDMFSLMPTNYTGCLGDLDGTGRVSPSDRGFIAANFGTREADSLCMYDLDGNGVVNADDRLVVSSSVGQCIPLPDHQNGSGLNQGVPDLRFRAGQQYMGFATTCEQVDCGDE